MERKEAVLTRMVWILAVFNTAMEKIVLPLKVRWKEGEKWKQLRHVTVNLVLHDDELEKLNSPFLSDQDRARIVVEGMKRSVLGRQPLVEPA